MLFLLNLARAYSSLAIRFYFSLINGLFLRGKMSRIYRFLQTIMQVSDWLYVCLPIGVESKRAAPISTIGRGGGGPGTGEQATALSHQRHLLRQSQIGRCFFVAISTMVLCAYL